MPPRTRGRTLVPLAGLAPAATRALPAPVAGADVIGRIDARLPRQCVRQAIQSGDPTFKASPDESPVCTAGGGRSAASGPPDPPARRAGRRATATFHAAS